MTRPHVFIEPAAGPWRHPPRPAKRKGIHPLVWVAVTAIIAVLMFIAFDNAAERGAAGHPDLINAEKG